MRRGSENFPGQLTGLYEGLREIKSDGSDGDICENNCDIYHCENVLTNEQGTNVEESLVKNAPSGEYNLVDNLSKSRTGVAELFEGTFSDGG